MPANEAYRKIWAVVRRIPAGRVATYGQVAAEAGYPRQPRLGGYAMANLTAEDRVPWHRVINAQGRISFPRGSARYREQKRRLEAEGIVFLKGRVDLARVRWRLRGEAPLLD